MFAIYKRTAEFKWKDRFSIEAGCTCNDSDPELLVSFDNLEDARKELSKHKTSIREFDSPIGKMFEVVEYIIQDQESFDVWDESELNINLLDENGNSVATCVSYQSAEEIFNKDDRELKIVLP